MNKGRFFIYPLNSMAGYGRRVWVMESESCDVHDCLSMLSSWGNYDKSIVLNGQKIVSYEFDFETEVMRNRLRDLSEIDSIEEIKKIFAESRTH